ncbi:MAG TPA: SRPBCC family protein [Pirellulaceae bacterium]|nr:SRPBCC family protein [Pirellulaceae bacterium]
MVTNILLGTAAALVVLLIGLVLIVAMRPADFRISRQLALTAKPEAVFPHVNELAKWRAWSPWEELDPGLRRTYEGPAAGEGASYAWSGNNKVGEGRMTITESQPSDLIRLRLEFIKPFQAINTTEFKFERNERGTLVIWSMLGRNSFMAKAFGLMMDMDKLIGKDFEKGLAKLKSVAETT